MGVMVCRVIGFQRFKLLGLLVDGREEFRYFGLCCDGIHPFSIKVEGTVKSVPAHGRGRDWMGFQSLPTQTTMNSMKAALLCLLEWCRGIPEQRQICRQTAVQNPQSCTGFTLPVPPDLTNSIIYPVQD